MLLPEKKEREYRFKLALRMGLPIFGLILVLVSTTLIKNYETLDLSFYIESILLLFVSVYFILYLIYKGFDVKITDPISKTFTREYLESYLEKEIQEHPAYTLISVSVDNISDINSRYGIKNGDRVLRFVAEWLEEFFKNQGLVDFPIGRIKGGDFVIGLEGEAIKYKVLMELLCLKSDALELENIELHISGAITDTAFSKKYEVLLDHLLELQEENRFKKELHFEADDVQNNDLEESVLAAIEKGSLTIASQKVFDRSMEVAFLELFVGLYAQNGKYIHYKKYMRIVNKFGLSLKFDMMVTKKVLQNSMRFSYPCIAFSISTSSLRNPLFFEFLKKELEKTEHRCEPILFFSEKEYYSKVSRFNAVIKNYKEIGVRIGIDRLGSYHSSFLYLRDLDLDIARFDGSYTKTQNFEKYHDILEGFNLIIHKKGMKSWVKMVETKEQLETMRKIGIDYIEGKLLSQLQEEKL